MHDPLHDELASAMRWHEAKNASVAVGSRIICDWDRLATRAAAPGRFRTAHDFQPIEAFGLAAVTRQSGELQTQLTVSHGGSRKVVKVTLAYTPPMSYLVLDTVRSEDLRRWMKVTGLPAHVLTLYRTALEVLEGEKAQRNAVAEAMKAMAPEKVTTVSIEDSLLLWQESHWREPLPTVDSAAFPAFAQRIFQRLKHRPSPSSMREAIQLAERMGRSLGHRPLRLQSTASGRVEIWMTTHDNAQADRLAPWVWCERWTLKKTRGLGWQRDMGRSTLQDVLPKTAGVGIEILHEWPDAAAWRGLAIPGGLRPGQRDQLMTKIDDSASSWRPGTDLWGDPAILFDACCKNEVSPGWQLALRLMGSVYRPTMNNLFVIVAMLPMPWLHAFQQSRGTPLQARIEAWAASHHLDLSRAALRTETGLIQANHGMRLFAHAPRALTRGRPSPTIPRLLGIDKRLGLDEPGAISYLPTAFQHWLAAISLEGPPHQQPSNTPPARK